MLLLFNKCQERGLKTPNPPLDTPLHVAANNMIDLQSTQISDINHLHMIINNYY